MDNVEVALARLEERSKALNSNMLDMQKSMDKISAKIDGLDSKFTTKDEFSPVRKVVYGALWIIGGVLITALFGTVIFLP